MLATHLILLIIVVNKYEKGKHHTMGKSGKYCIKINQNGNKTNKTNVLLKAYIKPFIDAFACTLYNDLKCINVH